MNSDSSSSSSRPGSRANLKSPGCDDLICLCNDITRGTIEDAIRNGADTLNKIFDATTAGVGPCGGSCRRKLQPMLDQYLQNGSFPAAPDANRSGHQRNNRRKR